MTLTGSIAAAITPSSIAARGGTPAAAAAHPIATAATRVPGIASRPMSRP